MRIDDRRTLTANKELRDFMDAHKIRLWQVGDKIGKAEAQVCVKLRHELSDKDKARFWEIVKNIVKERETNE